MSKSVSTVASVTLGMLLGVGPPANAQEIPGEVRPYFYLWGAPTDGWNAELTGLASQMVWHYAEWPPATIAAIVKDKADCQVNPVVTCFPPISFPTTDADHVCVVLRNCKASVPV